MLSALEFIKGYLNLAILEPKSQPVKKHEDYQATQFKLKLYEINMMDKMDLHSQIGEMISRDLVQTTTSMERINKMGRKIKFENQWKQEKVVTREKNKDK